MRILEEYREEIVISKSRFICCMNRAKSEDEARAYIEQIRKEFPDATHVCHAYVLGENKIIQRSSDNGEPSGTAGIPMLEAINHADIYDIVACVVRYFGGIKLGAGGLIRAYSGSVTSLLAKATKTEEEAFQQYEIQYPYDLSGSVEAWLRKNTHILDLSYDENVTCVFETQKENISQILQDISSGIATPTFLREIIKEKIIDG